MNFEYSIDSLFDAGNIEVLYTNQFIHYITFPIIGGFMFGYVTGTILDVDSTLHMFIVATIAGGALLSSLPTGYLADRFGRKKTIILSCLFYIVGSLISFNYLVVIAVGRFLVGIGLGISSTCCPLYIAEITPKVIRGRIITIYQICLTFGLFLASVVNATLNYASPTDRSPKTMPIILITPAVPALFLLIGMLTVPESYRWLLSKNRIDEAIEVVRKLKQIPESNITEFVENILEANVLIEEDLQEQKEQKKFILCRILGDKIARKTLVMGCSLQMLAQLIGINGLMYYANSLFQKYVTNNIKIYLWFTPLLTFINLISSFVAYKLIDKIGRRKLALISLFGIFSCSVIIAVNLQLFDVRYLKRNQNNNCRNFLSCDDCINNICEYCQIDENSGYTCVNSGANCTNKGNYPIYNFDNHCPNNINWILLLGMILYVISFAIGMGPIPWVVTSEIYPAWCRSTNMALSTTANWFFNFSVTMTVFPIGLYETFWIYSAFTLCGIALIYRNFPEMNQANMEEILHVL